MSKSNVIPLRPDEANDDNTLEKRWGAKVYSHGYTAVPSILVRGQRRLGLSAVQLNVLLQLLDHWWNNDEMPFPAKATIAERMDITPRYVQKVIKELEVAGFVKRVARKSRHGDPDTNLYDLRGLVKKLKKLEPDFAEARGKKRQIQENLEKPKGRRRK